MLVRDERGYDAQQRHPRDDQVDDERKRSPALPEGVFEGTEESS